MTTTKPLQLGIPAGLDFAALKLARDPDGRVSFDWTPIEVICQANGLDIDVFQDGPEDNVSGLIAAWYGAHLAQGGEPDPVQEDLLAEIRAEDALGGGLSHAPGRA